MAVMVRRICIVLDTLHPTSKGDLHSMRAFPKCGAMYPFALQGAGSAPGTYSLVTQFPRRVIQMSQYSNKATFADAGLTGRQEALLLEPAHG